MRGGHKRKTIERTNAERGREREREEEPGEQLYKEKEQSSDQKKDPLPTGRDENPVKPSTSWMKNLMRPMRAG